MMRSLVVVGLALCVLGSTGGEQLRGRLRGQRADGEAANPIDASRLPPSGTWEAAGAGTIPTDRTQCGSDIAAYNGTAGTINTALSGCAANTYVKLGAGTFNLTTGIVFNDLNNVTLRGNGPDSTFLAFATAGDGCGGYGSVAICLKNGNLNYGQDPGNTADWTSSYSQGTTTVVLDPSGGAATLANMAVGTILMLDQLDDDGTDTGITIPWICGDRTGTCSLTGTSGALDGYRTRNGRPQTQAVRVTAIEGGNCGTTGDGTCDVTITPGIYMPNFRTGQTPGAWWSNDIGATGLGLEDFGITSTGTVVLNHIRTWNVRNSWIQNVRSVFPDSSGAHGHHIWAIQSLNLTVRDSYFFNSKDNESESGGIQVDIGTDHLVENNIFQLITNPTYIQSMVGGVVAYNYTINHLYGDGNWTVHSMLSHGIANSHTLYEGNDTLGFECDDWFGTAGFFYTLFRNRFAGWENQAGFGPKGTAIHLNAFSRYINIVGNVLGWNAYHTTYATVAGGSDANANVSVYFLGLGDADGNGNGTTQPSDDTLTVTTLLRWGNYDTVNDATRWESSEVPSGIAAFSNAVPSTQTLPNSLYLSAKPAFFGAVDWPCIGPDVTGGSEANVGGHNCKIPARRCFEDTMGGVFGDTSAKTFNADGCY